jgi:nucleoside-triphosphatase THEP1
MSTPAQRPANPQFQVPPRVPWSELGGEFINAWGRPDGQLEPEHMEITGQTGSGKTYVLTALLQERALLRGSSEIFVATKRQDKVFDLLGWPVVDTWAELQKYRWAMFWPQTSEVGSKRKAYLKGKIEELLSRLWQPDANVVIAFDEIGTVEQLSAEIRELIRMYWREARSTGITVVAMKQRPVGVVRDQHSESRWKVVFPPADDDDMPRFAQLLGSPAEWVPVLKSLDQENHEFVIRNTVTKDAYISWIDYPLHPVAGQTKQAQDQEGRGDYARGGRRQRRAS